MNFLNFLAINMDHFWLSLDIMWKGVLAIFVVIALVILVTMLVNKICLYFENKKNSGDNQ